MWIRKEDYQGLRLEVQTLRDLAKLEQKKQVPFPTYYQEWLEYWRKRAKEELRPEPHRLNVEWDGDNNENITFGSNMDVLKEWLADARKRASETGFFGFKADRGPVIEVPVDKITTYEIIEGHPSPYTPAEIEAWAKERVEEEMKGWRVVAGKRTYPIISHVPNSLLKALYPLGEK